MESGYGAVEASVMIYPMFGMFVLTLIVLVLLFGSRVVAVRDGEISPRHFLTYSSGELERERTLAIARNFSNLFEAPVLFYVVSVAVMVLKVSSLFFLSMAWGYVALRALHSFIHTGSNNLRLRIFTYMGSWVFLAGMWSGLLIIIVRT